MFAADRREVQPLLAELNEIPGISGNEEAVGDAIERAMAGCADECRRDPLGNLLFTKKGRSEFTILLSAHMDEIGFLVSDIDDDGFVRLIPVGHHDPRLLQNQAYAVRTARGTVYGVSGPDTAPHELKGKSPPGFQWDSLRVDVGARSRKGAENLGIAVGCPVTLDRSGRMLGRNVFSGRAVDNRAGCTAMVTAMRMLRKETLDCTVVACGSVQEELGIKGIRTAARSVRPDAALSLDVCFGAYGDAVTPSHTRIWLGRGPAVQVYDWSPGSLLGNIVPRRLRERLLETAAKHRIPCQPEVTLDGGTDACEIALSGEGVPTGGINIPCRYMHTAVGAVDIRDVCNAAALIAVFLREAVPE